MNLQDNILIGYSLSTLALQRALLLMINNSVDKSNIKPNVENAFLFLVKLIFRSIL